MLKIYKITTKDLRACGWTGTDKDLDNSLRFENVEWVKSPKEADVISVPLCGRPEQSPQNLPQDLLEKIVKYTGQPGYKFTFFDCSDFEPEYFKVPDCMQIRSNLKGWMRRQNPRSISWAWPVEDLKHLTEVPVEGFKYPVGFQGWMRYNIRINTIGSVKQTFGNAFDVATYPDFYGYIENTPEGIRRKGEFQRSLRECKLQLAPCSIPNVFPYRFFEAISAARVPVLVCDDYSLPWEKQIPYNDFIITIPVSECHNTGPILKDWLSKHSTEQIIEMGKLGRKYYERYLCRDRANSLFTEAIEELLISEGRYVRK